MSDDWEPLEPTVPDEPYRTSKDDCPDCGANMPSWVCYQCGLTDQDIADRLTRA